MGKMVIPSYFGSSALGEIYRLLDDTIGMRSYFPLYRGYDDAANIQNLVRYTFYHSPNTNGAAQFSEIRRPQDEQSP